MKRLLGTYPLTLIILLVIVWLSLGTPPSPKVETAIGIDKIAHFCMYCGLTGIIWLEYLRHHSTLDRTKLVLFAILAPILFGGIMEIAQMTLTANREGDWFDFIANSTGVLCGALAGFYILKPLIRKGKR